MRSGYSLSVETTFEPRIEQLATSKSEDESQNLERRSTVYCFTRRKSIWKCEIARLIMSDWIVTFVLINFVFIAQEKIYTARNNK